MPTGEVTYTLTPPNNPNFIGRHVFFQWYLVDPAANSFGATFSGRRALGDRMTG